MILCIPVENDNGLNSTVCAHFGSAPAFMIVDADTKACRFVSNQNDHHAHGMCTPVDLLQTEAVDSMIVAGIGMGALNRLAQLNIKVFVSSLETVGKAVEAFAAGSLRPMEPGMTCRGHH